MTQPRAIEINPTAIYAEHDLIATGFFLGGELRNARLYGRLRFHEPRRGQRVYIGQWLLDWLTNTGCTVETGR